MGFALFGLLLAGRAQSILNPGFETDTFPAYPGYVSANFPITAWTATPADRVGLNPGGGTPFADNGTIPEGVNAAFIQNTPAPGASILSTTITGLSSGSTYRVSFRINARNGQTANLTMNTDGLGDIVATRVTSVGGANPYKYAAYEFTATGDHHILYLWNDIGGDNTVLVDDVSVSPSPGGWSFAPWNDDASSGLDAQYCYTHAYSFGNAALRAAINGVGFLPIPGGNPALAGKFSTGGLGNAFGAVTKNVSGDSAALANSFVYGGPVMSITLQNLKPNTAYVATIFGVAFDLKPYARAATFSSSLEPENRLTVDLDQYDQANGIRVDYAYTTDATGTVTINYAQTGDGSFHTSGFANREAAPAAPLPWTIAPWNDDSSSGVEPACRYTHAYTFGTAASNVVQGVRFIGIPGGNPTAADFSTANLPNVFNNDPNNITGFGRVIGNDFIYGGNPGRLTLTGLVPGKAYVLTIYSVGWDAPGLRRVILSGGTDCLVLADQNVHDTNNGIRCEYRYVADASGSLVVEATPIVPSNTLHWYGFSNREAVPSLSPVPGLYPTGVGAGVLADGAIDPHYFLVANPDGASLDALVQDSTAFPIVTGPWLANTAGSKWIGPRFDTGAAAGQASDGGAGPGVYAYQTFVDLTGFDPATVRISGSWATDNTGLDIRVNGVSSGQTVGGFNAFAPFLLTSANAPFVAGMNTIEFRVRNDDAVAGYTGLRVGEDLHCFAVPLPNQDPTAGTDGLATSRNLPATISVATLLANDSDPDTGAVFFSSVTAPSAQGGTVSELTGTVTYLPPADYLGSDSFTYTIHDGGGGTATGTVQVLVVDGPIPPAGALVISDVLGAEHLRFSGTSGTHYLLQRNTDLANPLGWVNLQDQECPVTGILEFQDPAPPSPRAYYRTKEN